MHTLAIHLIWTTYLTWPPGDPRGHWSALFDMYGTLVKPGRRLNLPDRVTRSRSMTLAKEPPKVLTPCEIDLTAAVIGDHIAPGLPGVGEVNQGNSHIAPGLPGVGEVSQGNPAQVPGYMGRYVTTPLKHVPPRCLAAAIEPTHVHLLVGPCAEEVSSFTGRLKGRTSSEIGKLSENAGRQRVWTEGYWNVFLFDEDAVRAVMEYINAHNVRRGLPAAPFAWIAGI